MQILRCDPQHTHFIVWQVKKKRHVHKIIEWEKEEGEEERENIKLGFVSLKKTLAQF